MKKITVVTISFNARDTIERTIKSVLAQKKVEFEYIAIDGGSKDGTGGLIQNYRQSLQYFVSEPDRGISDAFNKGIRNSNGEWIMFLNAGDSFVDDMVLSRVASELDDHFDGVFGQVVLSDDAGQSIKTVGQSFERARLLKYMCVPHQGLFLKRAFFDEVGLFSEELRIAMDYELLLRREALRLKYLPFPISNMLIGGVSQQEPKRVFREFAIAKLMRSDKSMTKIWFEYIIMRVKHGLSKPLKRLLLPRGL